MVAPRGGARLVGILFVYIGPIADSPSEEDSSLDVRRRCDVLTDVNSWMGDVFLKIADGELRVACWFESLIVFDGCGFSLQLITAQRSHYNSNPSYLPREDIGNAKI